MPVSSHCTSYFSWIFTDINFYLLATYNWVKQLYFCMIGSFVISNKAACEVGSLIETPALKSSVTGKVDTMGVFI